MIDGLLIPALGLALAGWLVPRGLFLLFPEGVRPLLWLGACATLILFVLGGLAFFALYLVQGVPLEVLFAPRLGPTLLHFARLGLASSLIWAPLMLLSIAGLPRLWVHETW